jgi:hypothetical protein
MDFSELTLDELSLISMLRRLESQFGEDKTQLVVFLGDKTKAEQVKEIILSMEEVEREDSYDGDMHYILIKVAKDAEQRSVLRQNAHEMIDELFQEYDPDLFLDNDDDE